MIFDSNRLASDINIVETANGRLYNGCSTLSKALFALDKRLTWFPPETVSKVVEKVSREIEANRFRHINIDGPAAA